MKWNIIRTFSRVGLTIMTFVATFELGTIKGRYGLGQSKYIWNSFNELPPTELLEKVGAYNNLVTIIWVALIFFLLYQLADYLHNPKDHYWTTIKNKFERLGNG